MKRFQLATFYLKKEGSASASWAGSMKRFGLVKGGALRFGYLDRGKRFIVLAKGERFVVVCSGGALRFAELVGRK